MPYSEKTLERIRRTHPGALEKLTEGDPLPTATTLNIDEEGVLWAEDTMTNNRVRWDPITQEWIEV